LSFTVDGVLLGVHAQIYCVFGFWECNSAVLLLLALFAVVSFSFESLVRLLLLKLWHDWMALVRVVQLKRLQCLDQLVAEVIRVHLCLGLDVEGVWHFNAEVLVLLVHC